MTLFIVVISLVLAISFALHTKLERQDTAKGKWTSIALTADCKTIYGSIAGDGILYGNDLGFSTTLSGYDWYQSYAWYRNWQAIAMSSKKEVICAVMNGDVIHTSTNGFSSWNVSSVPVAAWSATAISENGKHIFATQNQLDGTIFRSHNFGAKWAQSRISVVGPWCSVACSSMGKYVAAVSCNGGIHLSNNYGDDFVLGYPGPAPFSAITIDGTGKYIVAAVSEGKIHYSHDFGMTWVTAKSPVANWRAIASSKCGQFVYAVIYEGGMFYSEDYGITWSMSESPVGKWSSIATSSDGSCIAASDYDGYVYANHRDVFAYIPGWLVVIVSIIVGLFCGVGLVWLICVISFSDFCQRLFSSRISNPYRVDESLLPTRG